MSFPITRLSFPEYSSSGHAQKAEIYFRGLHKPGSKQQQVKMESKDSKLIKKTGRKTPKYCCICKGIYRGKVIDGRKVSLHRFPQNKRLKRVWVQRCKTVMRSFQWNEHRRLCSEHFVGFRGPSFQHTLPSMFPTETGATKTFQPTVFFISYISLSSSLHAPQNELCYINGA